MRKKKEKSIVLPGLFFDNQSFVPASKYPSFTIFTDICLAETLQVSANTVKTWRVMKVIPHTMQGNFAVYDVNAVLKSLQEAGYTIDPTKKSTK